MTALLLGVGVGGLLVGAGVAYVVTVRRLSGRFCPDPDAHELSAEDRDHLTAEFAGHVSAVQRQVEDYADVLAAGDAVLRERLRRFEGGGR